MPQLTRPNADIEYLLLREFPQYLWLMPPPISPGHGNLVVPITPEQKQQQDDLRQRIEHRRQELLTLRLTNSNEFAKLVAELRAMDAAEAEAKRFFNQPQARADFSHWAKLDYWTLEEGVALCFGRSPKFVTKKSVESDREVSPFARQFMDALEIATRARAMNQIQDSNLPGFFIAWAKRMDLPFPTELEALVAKRAPIMDWQTACEQWQEAYGKATARVAELEQELAAARVVAPDQATSVDARERKNMLRVIRALEGMAKLPARGATTSVEAQLQQLGFDGPKEATIRKLLDQARALEADNRNSG